MQDAAGCVSRVSGLGWRFSGGIFVVDSMMFTDEEERVQGLMRWVCNYICS